MGIISPVHYSTIAVVSPDLQDAGVGAFNLDPRWGLPRGLAKGDPNLARSSASPDLARLSASPDLARFSVSPDLARCSVSLETARSTNVSHDSSG